MKSALPLSLLSLFSSALLLPSAAFARDRVSVGFSVGNGPAWGCRSPFYGSYGPYSHRFRSYGPTFSYSYYSGGYPVYSTPYYPPPVLVAPPAPIYYAPPAYGSATYVTPVPSTVQVIRGDSTVLQIQSALRQKKYYRGAIDGLNGPETRAAIRAYQVDRGLPVTGQIDSDLLSDLIR